MSKPVCWIIAGPNGAGKTTFALKYLPNVEMSMQRVAECVSQIRCFMNSGNDPELVFVQNDKQRNVLAQDAFDVLVKKAKR